MSSRRAGPIRSRGVASVGSRCSRLRCRLRARAADREAAERPGHRRSRSADRGALAMALVDRRASEVARAARPSDGMALGLAEALALVPGVSRNGATLAIARAGGFDRGDADSLSWLAALPVIYGAGALKGARAIRRGVPRRRRSPLAMASPRPSAPPSPRVSSCGAGDLAGGFASVRDLPLRGGAARHPPPAQRRRLPRSPARGRPRAGRGNRDRAHAVNEQAADRDSARRAIPLDALIGHGGMSTVYRAFDTVLERPVAIKLMHREIASNSEQLERFRREARAVAQLNHPHIVTVIDAGEELPGRRTISQWTEPCPTSSSSTWRARRSRR